MTYGEERRAIVVGYRGQDGQLLCEQLLNSGVSLIGVGVDSLYHAHSDIGDYPTLVDVTCMQDVVKLVSTFQPNEIYYLAAFHHSSQESTELPPLEFYQKCYAVNVTGLLHFLEAARFTSSRPRVFYASSSLIFSAENTSILTEKSPYSPSGFYAITKVNGMQLCREYREQHQVFASTGILFNHESALRPSKFLSQKIIRSAFDISSGNIKKLVVGDLNAQVDWGYAPDYVKAFREILSCDQSDDFIVASGEAHTVQEFIEVVFDYFKLDWREHVVENGAILARRLPAKVGSTSLLQARTAWRYSRNFKEMVTQLIEDTGVHLRQSGCQN
jgi:GDPmannose 4,6-dehydratase